MSIPILTDRLWFPPVDSALSDGLLALGGDLSKERLLLAYHMGIFPWYDTDLPMWWSPDPRFVLFPSELKISKSMKVLLKKNVFEFRFNQAFDQVIQNCQQIYRPDQDGTWITNEVVRGYTELHNAGYAISAESWLDGVLVGGLYGVRLGNIFFGESMFARRSNASKYAFIKLVEKLRLEGVRLIDCQLHTTHLESLGAIMIPRHEFMGILKREVPLIPGVIYELSDIDGKDNGNNNGNGNIKNTRKTY